MRMVKRLISLAPQRMAEGDKIISSEKADIKIGNTLAAEKYACWNNHSQRGNENW
jgi:ribosomal protein L2